MLVRHRFFAALLIGAAISAAIAGPAFADARDISVGGVYICTITHDWAGISSYDRAVEVNRRITRVLSDPVLRQGAVVAVGQQGANGVVMVGNQLVFTVTPADAAGSGSTTYVARRWASLLADGLAKALPGSTFHF